MPRNKRESLIYTVLMCFTMVLWMSIYNVSLHMGALNLTTIREAWIGFPIAYVFGSSYPARQKDLHSVFSLSRKARYYTK